MMSTFDSSSGPAFHQGMCMKLKRKGDVPRKRFAGEVPPFPPFLVLVLSQVENIDSKGENTFLYSE